MAKEIERKFLVSQLPSSVTHGLQPTPIQQGYLTEDPAGQQVRIRSKGQHYYLTVKGRGNLERDEVEVALTVDQFEALWPLTQGRRIQKKRYALPYRDHTIELDVFGGNLTGLVVAEIEFATVEKSAALKTPDWFGEEVTYDFRYTNSQLANLGEIPS
jgi:CYTH domain-containing protein